MLFSMKNPHRLHTDWNLYEVLKTDDAVVSVVVTAYKFLKKFLGNDAGVRVLDQI